MIALNLGTEALTHPLSIFEGRRQSLTCDSLTRRNGAIRQSVTMRCVTGVSIAAAVGDCCLARAAKASRPFGGSRHLPLALTEGARSHPGEDYCSWLSVAFTCPKLESWSGEAQLTEPISQHTEELSYTLVSYLKLFNVFNLYIMIGAIDPSSKFAHAEIFQGTAPKQADSLEVLVNALKAMREIVSTAPPVRTLP
eukprot:COSAG03_NODE_3286_length_2100_cov_3.301849_4_plen_196_part_00